MGVLEASHESDRLHEASGILPRFRGPTHCKELHVRLRDLIHPSRVLLAVLGIAMLAAGCRSHRAADDAKSGPEVIYARAQKAMKNSSCSKPCSRASRSANPRANRSWI
jgi:hypothetical protein